MQTRTVMFVALQGYQRGLLRWSWNEAYIAIRWYTAGWTARKSCLKCCFLFLLAVSDNKRLDTSSHFVITNFHTELKSQENVSKYMNYLTTQRLINHGQSVKHTTLIKFDWKLKFRIGSSKSFVYMHCSISLSYTTYQKLNEPEKFWYSFWELAGVIAPLASPLPTRLCVSHHIF